MIGKGIRNQIMVAILATIGAMVMGTILGWSSPAQLLLTKNIKYNITDDDAKLYSSVFGVGAVFGALPSGTVSGMIGRCGGMVLYELFIVVGWIILILFRSVWMLTIGRILQGIGVGALCAIIPTYVGEISEPRVRGSLGSIFQVYVVIGILYSFIFGTFLKYVSFNIVCSVWTIIHLVGVFIIPESPYYLLNKNKVDKAKVSMTKLRDANEGSIEQELVILKQNIELERTQQHSFRMVLADPVNRKALLIGIGCMFFQQTCGINVIVFYMGDIFKITGSKISPEMSSITVGIVQLVMTFITMAVIDRTGRRVLLITSSVFMCLCFIGLSIFFFMKDMNKESVTNIGWLPLVLIATYISAFSIGFGPVPWVVMGEIFSTEVKPYGTSLATAVNWLLVFTVTYLPSKITKLIGFKGLFLTYSFFCFIGGVFVFFVIPETKNKSLGEIQSMLAGSSTPTQANTNISNT